MNRFGDDLPTTIVHGDYRLDNMFFASPQGGPEFAVIDWQIAHARRRRLRCRVFRRGDAAGG